MGVVIVQNHCGLLKNHHLRIAKRKVLFLSLH